MKPGKLNNKRMYITDTNGCSLPRCYWSRRKGKESPSVLVKCGDCNEKVKIYYGKGTLEVNGVLASNRFWKTLFEFLLKDKKEKLK